MQVAKLLLAVAFVNFAFLLSEFVMNVLGVLLVAFQ